MMLNNVVNSNSKVSDQDFSSNNRLKESNATLPVMILKSSLRSTILDYAYRPGSLTDYLLMLSNDPTNNVHCGKCKKKKKT